MGERFLCSEHCIRYERAAADDRCEGGNNSDNPMFKKHKNNINANYWRQFAAIPWYVETGTKEYSPCKPC